MVGDLYALYGLMCLVVACLCCCFGLNFVLVGLGRFDWLFACWLVKCLFTCVLGWICCVWVGICVS